MAGAVAISGCAAVQAPLNAATNTSTSLLGATTEASNSVLSHLHHDGSLLSALLKHKRPATTTVVTKSGPAFTKTAPVRVAPVVKAPVVHTRVFTKSGVN